MLGAGVADDDTAASDASVRCFALCRARRSRAMAGLCWGSETPIVSQSSACSSEQKTPNSCAVAYANAKSGRVSMPACCSAVVRAWGTWSDARSCLSACGDSRDAPAEASAMTHAMCLHKGGGGSSEVKEARPKSKPHAVRTVPEASGGCRLCQQPQGPVQA